MDNIDVIKCIVNAVKYCEPILGRSVFNPDFNNIDETDISF